MVSVGSIPTHRLSLIINAVYSSGLTKAIHIMNYFEIKSFINDEKMGCAQMYSNPKKIAKEFKKFLKELCEEYQITHYLKKPFGPCEPIDKIESYEYKIKAYQRIDNKIVNVKIKYVGKDVGSLIPVDDLGDMIYKFK